MTSFDDLHTFAERLELVRKMRGFSMDTLASMVGFRDRRSLFPYTRGKIAPTIVLVRKLSEALDVDPTYLAGWDLLLR